MKLLNKLPDGGITIIERKEDKRRKKKAEYLQYKINRKTFKYKAHNLNKANLIQ